MKNNPTIDGGARDHKHCPFCKTLTVYTHRDGVQVCKCPVKTCKGHERGLECAEFAELAPPQLAEHYPHGHPLHKAVFMALESYGAWSFEQGVTALVEQSHELQATLKKQAALMQEFCDRVDRGEVRSKVTYAKFKACLASAAQPIKD